MILETERLVIRPWQTGDAAHYEALSKDIGYNCFAPPGAYLVRDEAEALEKIGERVSLYERHGIGKFPVFLKEGGQCIGTCGFSFYTLDGAQELELGYRFALNHWGNGYATEAGKTLVRHAFQNLNRPRIFAFAIRQNPASLKIIEKLGFQYRSQLMHAGLEHRLFVMTPEDLKKSG